MIKKKLFLASSSELKEDRKEFEILISRKNNGLSARGIFLELVVWEDFVDAVSQTRLQDEYNDEIRQCDIFTMLFCTKVGQYTAEEFETAFQQFKVTNKPSIFTYFKDAPISTGSANQQDFMSLWAFQEKLQTLGHFYTVYKNIDDLKFQFNRQLDKLDARGFFGPNTPIVSPPPTTPNQVLKSVTSLMEAYKNDLMARLDTFRSHPANTEVWEGATNAMDDLKQRVVAARNALIQFDASLTEAGTSHDFSSLYKLIARREALIKKYILSQPPDQIIAQDLYTEHKDIKESITKELDDLRVKFP